MRPDAYTRVPRRESQQARGRWREEFMAQKPRAVKETFLTRFREAQTELHTAQQTLAGLSELAGAPNPWLVECKHLVRRLDETQQYMEGLRRWHRGWHVRRLRNRRPSLRRTQMLCWRRFRLLPGCPRPGPVRELRRVAAPRKRGFCASRNSPIRALGTETSPPYRSLIDSRVPFHQRPRRVLVRRQSFFFFFVLPGKFHPSNS